MASAVTDDDRTTKALTTAPSGAAPKAAKDPTKDLTNDSFKDSADPSDEITRLRDEIALRRQRLDSALDQLEHRVSEDLDWRRRVTAHPWLALGAAFLAGYAMGRLAGGPAAARRAREVEPG